VHQSAAPFVPAEFPEFATQRIDCAACAQPLIVLYVRGESADNLFECPHCLTIANVHLPGVLVNWCKASTDERLSAGELPA
jgi:hypothetical protein